MKQSETMMRTMASLHLCVMRVRILSALADIHNINHTGIPTVDYFDALMTPDQIAKDKRMARAAKFWGKP